MEQTTMRDEQIELLMQEYGYDQSHAEMIFDVTQQTMLVVTQAFTKAMTDFGLSGPAAANITTVAIKTMRDNGATTGGVE